MIEPDAFIELLDEYGVSWDATGHKNISRKCLLGIDCIYCGDDTNKHLGVFRDLNGFSCFRCKSRGSLYKLCRDLLGLTFDEFNTLLLEPRMTDKHVSQRIKERLGLVKYQEQREIKEVKLPKNALKNKKISKLAYYEMKKFFKNRKNPIKVSVANQYGAYPCFAGKYKGRLILPVFDRKNNPVAFQARDMITKTKLPYLNPDLDMKKLLYGINRFKGDTAIICEGVFDCWRVGLKSLGTFGVGLSVDQVELLKQLGVNHLIFAWDYDAYRVSVENAMNWSPLFDTIKILNLPYEEDPDSLGRSKIFKLIKSTSIY